MTTPSAAPSFGGSMAVVCSCHVSWNSYLASNPTFFPAFYLASILTLLLLYMLSGTYITLEIVTICMAIQQRSRCWHVWHGMVHTELGTSRLVRIRGFSWHIQIEGGTARRRKKELHQPQRGPHLAGGRKNQYEQHPASWPNKSSKSIYSNPCSVLRALSSASPGLQGLGVRKKPHASPL